MQFLLLSSTFIIIHYTNAHVRLTFPESRWPPLDFLDSYRTQAPCGIPMTDGGKLTYLASGQAYNVTWHQGYPHQGGYRITLLDKRGQRLTQLTEGGFAGTETPLIEHRGIILPSGSICDHCILQLERQATEYGAEGYMFHSCADIVIVPPSSKDNIQLSCNGHGRLISGACSCDRMFHGDLCQYEDDCQDVTDCSNHGTCVEMNVNTYPRKLCYCSPPYFGRKCQKKFQPKSNERYCFNYNYPSPVNVEASSGIEDIMFTYGLFNKNCYSKSIISSGVQVYWRILGDDIEIVLDYPGKSWIALGWRPADITEACQAYPFGQEKTVPTTTAEPIETKLPDLEDSAKPRRDTGVPPEPVAEAEDPVLLEDSVYGHGDSLKGAFGIEANGRTIIMFRKPIKASEPTDHTMNIGKMTIGWAYGQDWSDSQRSSDPFKQFYTRDEIKYHGRVNRGVSEIQFLPQITALKAGQRSASCTNNYLNFSKYLMFTLVVYILSVI